MFMINKKSSCGIDIVEIERFKKMIERLEGQSFKQIFTSSEWETCQNKPDTIQSLAARFAAKEACLKLFPRETNSKKLEFSDIEIVMDHYGAPTIHINDKLNNIMKDYGYSRIFISLSHTKNYACSVAMAE